MRSDLTQGHQPSDWASTLVQGSPPFTKVVKEKWVEKKVNGEGSKSLHQETCFVCSSGECLAEEQSLRSSTDHAPNSTPDTPKKNKNITENPLSQRTHPLELTMIWGPIFPGPLPT